MNDKSLVNYGYGFQVKIISSLLTDVNFCGKVVDILKVDYFEADAIKFLIKSCIDYFVSYKKTPTLEVLKVNIDTIDSELIKQEVVRSLKEAYINISASDLDFIKETTINFCKNQELKNAILKSVDLLKFEKYDDIKSVIDSAMKVGIDYDIGTDYIQDIDIRYTPDNRIPVPTGWAPIDQILKGGLSAGELGVIVAPSGIGKCVGGDTKIKIEYESIGINLKSIIDKDVTVWIDPWDEIEVENRIFKAHDLISLFTIVSELQNK